MEHAAKNLTPVTLELGGKRYLYSTEKKHCMGYCVLFFSPAIVADDADINVAAQRIMWGKHLNAGQTCIAPDYVLCSQSKVDKFVECCEKALKKYFGDNPKQSTDFGRIINDRHFQ